MPGLRINMKNNWQAKLDSVIDHRADHLVSVRRHLHAHPEVSGHEHETSLYLYQMLSDVGFDVRMGPDGRGLMVDRRDQPDAPRIALRADIDALRIHDEKAVDYHSQHVGVMHACGHDAHSSIVLGALFALYEMDERDELPWPVNMRGIFQPSEETATGAAEMVEAGALQGVDSILATHVDPTRCVGQIGVRAGVMTANCDAMHFRLTGRGGHAARPHETIDPIAAAAQLINSIYLTIPRATDSQDAVVVTIGQIQGGGNPNVIPELVELRGTVRTLDLNVRQQTVDHIERICRGVAESSGTDIEVEFGSRIRSVRNDAEMTEVVRNVARHLLGNEQIDEITRASMGSEDFAVYLDHVPGAMFRLGCAEPGKSAPPLHTPTFDVDEAAIPIGAKLLARAAIYWSDPSRLRRGPTAHADVG
jgi:amidohydrolase